MQKVLEQYNYSSSLFGITKEIDPYTYSSLFTFIAYILVKECCV